MFDNLLNLNEKKNNLSLVIKKHVLAKSRSELLLMALSPQLRSGSTYSFAFGILMSLVTARPQKG